MIEANERGNERYAAFGLRCKQLFALKGKMMAAKATAAKMKLKAALTAKAKVHIERVKTCDELTFSSSMALLLCHQQRMCSRTVRWLLAPVQS